MVLHIIAIGVGLAVLAIVVGAAIYGNGRSGHMNEIAWTPTGASVRLPQGCLARDTVTGLQGRVTAYAMYLTGCDQVCLSTMNSTGDEIKGAWFDVKRLERVGTDTIALPGDVLADPGGPQDHPPTP